jgi:sulfur-oxidizing protein SoxA
MKPTIALLAAGLLAASSAPWAQPAAQPAPARSAAEGIAEYRALLADGNPAELFEARGENLWKTRRGPKNASLERCDLGKGPGVIKGAFVELPRWFEDSRKVEDLESRLATCMVELQGFSREQIVNTPFNSGLQNDITALATFVATASKGLPFALPQGHPEERRSYEIGKRAFFFRGGPMDFSCGSCHAVDGQRIRLQDLPTLTKNPGDGVGFAAWPAYRVSAGQMWGMQLRINDCFRQMRFPYPVFASEPTIALGTFMGVNARGAKSAVPTIKR